MGDAALIEAQKVAKTQTPIYMQVFIGIIANLVIISPGMNLGFSAVALPALTSSNNFLSLSQEQGAWVASITSVAMPIGCLLSGPFLDQLGRKFTMYSVNVFMIIGWGIIATTDTTRTVEKMYYQLLIGRFIAGIGCGLCSVPATVYMSEIATPKLRGMVCAWSSVAFAFGVQLIYILGFFYKDNWRLLAIISGILPVFSIVLIRLFITESPIWYQNNYRYQKYENSLKKLQGYGPARKILVKETQEEKLLAKERKRNIITTINNSVYNETCVGNNKIQTHPNKCEMITSPECWKPFLLMTSFFFFQQFSGIFVIIYYAVHIVKATGSTIDPYIASICIGSIRTGVALVVSYLSQHCGRRFPSILSGIGMTICLFILSGYLFLIQNNYAVAFLEEHFFWVPIAALMLFFFMSTFGFLTVPFMMVGEVYPAKNRGLLGGLTVCACYIFSFVVVRLYPIMLTQLGSSGLFLFYSIISFIGTLFVIVFLPETKGKTLAEIEAIFKPVLTGLKQQEAYKGVSITDDK